MKLLKIAAVAIAVVLLSAARVWAADELPAATLTVTGSGEIVRAPDSAAVDVAIVTNDDNAERALSENNRRFAALSAKLAATGVSAGDVTSTSIQSYFNARPADRTAAAGQLYGFVVTRSASIAVHALAQTGAVVDAATAAGATQINGVSYGFRDRRAVERMALAAAVADAYAQAQAIAAAANLHILRVVRIGNEAPPARIMPMALSMAKTANDAVPTSIGPSDLHVAQTVTITYAVR